MKKFPLLESVKQYHFEIKHLLVIFVILMFFQLSVALIQKLSLRNFLLKSQKWYQQDFAERLANLTATSMEMILETTARDRQILDEEAQKIMQAFNIILSQQLLQQHVQEVCILIGDKEQIAAIDNGHVLYSYLFEHPADLPPPDRDHSQAISMYRDLKDQIFATEQTHSLIQEEGTFHVFVPFVPKGEYFGALYMRSRPEFGFVTSGILTTTNETSLIFSGLIFFGLLAMFYISSYTVKERDEAQQLLFQERERQIEQQVHRQKEMQFTKRIYHTHHKAEKIMGFIKEDLRQLSLDNFETIKDRMSKYANFISRVIYDMKWYDPPLQTIRNPIFRTDVNDVLRFLVDNIFFRVAQRDHRFQIELDLDDTLPPVPINEFVIWEIFEPLIQNCVEHAGETNVKVSVKTRYLLEEAIARVYIEDNGAGIAPELLEKNEKGVKKIFLENMSTKKDKVNAGYGCFIAYEIASQRCGWTIDADNTGEGARFVVTIPFQSGQNSGKA